MGMFDSYYVSVDFKCPICGEERWSSKDFQSKAGDCALATYKLGSKIDDSLRYWIWYDICRKCKCDLMCKVYIDEAGIAYRERIYALDKDNEEILISDSKK